MEICDYCGGFCMEKINMKLEMSAENGPHVYKESHKFCSADCVASFYSEAFLNSLEIQEWVDEYLQLL